MKDAEEALEQTHKQLLETSRMAGMAEVATGVLHNVGNVLNSVNVSADLDCRPVAGVQGHRASPNWRSCCRNTTRTWAGI